jgi:hypothetical protein
LKGYVRLFIILITLSLIACQKDIPEPETKSLVVSAAQLTVNSRMVTKSGESFQVKYFVKRDDVFIECYIPNFSFRDLDQDGKQTGKMHVYVDGKKVKEFSSAAFSIKDLQSGNHRITLEVVGFNGQKTSFKKELIVTIP